MVGLIPQTVETARLQQANALFGLDRRTPAWWSGPRSPGVLIALTGPGEAIAIDAVTFLVSALFLSRLRPAELARGRPGRGGPARRARAACARAGASCAARAGSCRASARSSRTPSSCCPSIFVLGPALAERDLGGATAWAAIATAFGVGAVVGSVVAYRVRFERTLVVVLRRR